MIGGIGAAELLMILFLAAMLLLPFYKIFAKAGYPGILGFAMIVSVVEHYHALLPCIQRVADP